MAIETSQSVFGASGAAGSTSKAGTSRVKLAEDMDTFLTMLTAQLKHQDPLSPMDSTEFTNQLVQFAQVEQQINGNDHLEELLKLQRNDLLSQAVSYIGSSIKAESDQLALQDANADFTYLLPEKAETLTMRILDASGMEVRTVEMTSVQAGEHVAAWDGTANGGAQLADGAYKVIVEYENGDGHERTARTSTIGRVTSVSAEDGVTMLSLGATQVALDKVIAVVERQQADPA